MITPPKTENELLSRCQKLVGITLGQLAYQLDIDVPADLRRNKGWVGTLLEVALGADAGNYAQPDFTKLGIEMKTLPLNSAGQPKESTYVCTVSMKQTGELKWEDSWLRKKLSHVLWVPIEAEHSTPIRERYIGQPLLWKPSRQQEAILEQDWNELMDKIVLGEQAEITAKEGQYLQLRPKAANSKVLAQGVSADGVSEYINPKGFYLRTVFTQQILNRESD